MNKMKISLSNLEMIKYPKSNNPKDMLLKQGLNYNDDGSYTHYYKCPCGKRCVIDDKDATPGFRSHDIWIECEGKM